MGDELERSAGAADRESDGALALDSSTRPSGLELDEAAIVARPRTELGRSLPPPQVYELPPPYELPTHPAPLVPTPLAAPTSASAGFARAVRATLEVTVGAALWVDARLGRARGFAAVAGAVSVNLVLWLAPGWYAFALPVYALLLWALFIGQLWTFRDEDGAWTAAGAWERTRSLFYALRELGESLWDGAWSEAARRFGRLLLGISVVGFTVALPTQRLFEGRHDVDSVAAWVASASESFFVASVTGLALGTLVWLAGFGWQYRSRLAFLRGGRPDGRQLPLVIDLSRGGVPPSTPAKLRPLLKAIHAWRPRSEGYQERDFENSLRRHLNRSIKGAQVERQVRLENGGQVDLRFQGSVLIELKATLRRGELDRSVGQLGGYAASWREGPILLLQCRRTEGFVGEAAQRYQLLRNEGHDVTILVTEHP